MAFESSSLFLTQDVLGYPKEMVKTAGTKLGRDPSKWEQEIVSAFHEQHPYVQDIKMRVHINRSDDESGTLLGQIVLDEKAAVPIIVDKFQLQPFDLFLHEDKLRPLTKQALLDVVQGTGLGKPVDPGIGEISDVSIYNVTQPPFAGKYSFASSLTFSLDEYEKALNTLGPAGLEYALQTNSAFNKAASVYAASAGQKKEASVKTLAYSVEPLEFEAFENVNGSGIYDVLAGGMQKTAGFVFANVVSLTENRTLDEKLFCSPEGKIALAADIGGRLHGSFDLSDWTSDPTEPGIGFFWGIPGKEALATAPLRIHYSGTDASGRGFIKAAELSPHGKVLTIYPSSDYAPHALHVTGDEVFLGGGWRWKACNETVKVAEAWVANRASWPACNEIRHADGRWTLHGLDFPEFIREGDSTAGFFDKLAARFGEESTLSLMKEAEETGFSFFRASRPETPAVKATVDWEVPNLVREAAFIRPVKGEFCKLAVDVEESEATNTVDAVLGLNFLNDENLIKFVEGIDTLDDALGILSKLLLASRMGLSIEESPIRTALFSLDDVIRQLRQLKSTLYSDED